MAVFMAVNIMFGVPENILLVKDSLVYAAENGSNEAAIGTDAVKDVRYVSVITPHSPNYRFHRAFFRYNQRYAAPYSWRKYRR